MKKVTIALSMLLVAPLVHAAPLVTDADLDGEQIRVEALYEYANLAVRGSKLQSDKDNALLTALTISRMLSQRLPSMIIDPYEALTTCRELASEHLFMDGNATPAMKVPLLKFLQADCLRNVGQKKLATRI